MTTMILLKVKRIILKNSEVIMMEMNKMDIYRENYSALHQIAREFDRSIAEEIIARIFCGESVDCAIQSVICREEK